MMQLKHYKLETLMGKGGMGVVYLATNQKNGEKVAVKQIWTEDFLEMVDLRELEEAKQRFRREYKLLSLVNHRHVVKVHELIEEDNDLFLVQEYAPGISLECLISEAPFDLTMRDKIAIASQAARAVEVLNTAGIIHRDIKPANFMIDGAKKNVKLLDLGAGKAMTSDFTQITERGMTLGTPQYMSPEQAIGELAPQTDIFALGVSLYQFFLDEEISPFFTKGAVETINRAFLQILTPIIAKLPPQSSPLEQYACEKLSHLIDRATEKIPHLRPSARELAESLEDIYSLLDEAQEASWIPGSPLTPEQMADLQKVSDEFSDEFSFCSLDELATTYYQYGMSHYLLKEYHSAINSLSQVLKIDPQHLDAHNYRALACQELGEWEDALDDWERIVELNPENPVPYYNRGSILRKMGYTSEALMSYSQALQIDPGFADAHYYRGKCLQEIGRVAEAIEDYAKAVKLSPEASYAEEVRSYIQQHQQI